jgi:DNA repair exonuclease SbcCD nuclease subunit
METLGAGQLVYRFVHAADIHLDSPMRSLALRDPDLAELIGNATRRAFVALVDLCLNEQVDALLLAGDLHDGEQTSMKTARFLAEQVRRLHEAGIRVFIIRGNHDAMSKITRELSFPDSVKVFGSRAEAVPIEGVGGGIPITVHGLSFAKPHAPDSLLPQFKAPTEGAVNIGLMHTSLAGAAGHDLYAPCNIADLRASGFRYWALGHIHKRTVVEGDCAIVMPGMPQGRDVNEAGPKSVTLVTVADDKSIRIDEHTTSLAQFERVTVDVTGLADWPDIADAFQLALERARSEAVSPHLVARLRLSGVTPLAWRIRRDLDILKAEADDRGLAVGQCWVEKIEVDCVAPGASALSPGNPISELRSLIDEEVIRSEAYQAEVEKIAVELRSQLPQECRGIFGSDEASSRDAIERLAKEGSDDVLARLHAADIEEAA